jgi:hypothetical protein
MVGLTSKIKPHKLTQQSWKCRRRGPTRQTWQTKPKKKKKKKQCIRYQIFWLTYQNNKKKPIRKKNKEPKPRTT